MIFAFVDTDLKLIGKSSREIEPLLFGDNVRRIIIPNGVDIPPGSTITLDNNEDYSSFMPPTVPEPTQGLFAARYLAARNKATEVWIPDLSSRGSKIYIPGSTRVMGGWQGLIYSLEAPETTLALAIKLCNAFENGALDVQSADDFEKVILQFSEPITNIFQWWSPEGDPLNLSESRAPMIGGNPINQLPNIGFNHPLPILGSQQTFGEQNYV